MPPWTKNDYPASMENSDSYVRENAIEIANALVQEEHYEDGKAIPIEIDKTREYAENHQND